MIDILKDLWASEVSEEIKAEVRDHFKSRINTNYQAELEELAQDFENREALEKAYKDLF